MFINVTEGHTGVKSHLKQEHKTQICIKLIQTWRLKIQAVELYSSAIPVIITISIQINCCVSKYAYYAFIEAHLTFFALPSAL